jgi:peptidoglycan/xylan/chitin deacetylase (PgdA/CDA1 family)
VSDSQDILITIDVETDWGGRLSATRDNCKGIWFGIPPLLDMLTEKKVKATFFISGQVVPMCRKILRDIVSNGHEIASHGYDHQFSYETLSYSKLFDQLQRSKEILEDLASKKIFGIRVPQFRFPPFLYQALNECGYRYDSSVVSGGRFSGRYNYTNYPREPFYREGIFEIPVGTLHWPKVPLGLLWINALGAWSYKLQSRFFTLPNPQVIYLHPFDLLMKKNKGDFNFSLKLWYSFRSRQALPTFHKLLYYWDRRGYNLLTMQDYYLQHSLLKEDQPCVSS